jgi:ADP-heptose:LPS heptosyltransferase
MNAIVTLVIGEEYKNLFKLTNSPMKKYADKIGAEFVILDKQILSKSLPQWEKFRLFNLLNKYDRIIYLDSDLVVRDDCPNLFEIVPEDSIGLFNEAPFVSRNGLINEVASVLKINVEENGKYYNTGVMIVSKKHKFLFELPKVEVNNFFEQTYFNVKLLDEKVKVFDLDYNFNRMSCIDRFNGISRLDSFIVHYAGCPSLELMKSLIKKDLENWEKDKPNYKYKQRVHISVSGGLGDQVCAQPAIRFMKEKILPEAEIIVETHFPRLFKDIEGIQVYKHGEFIPLEDTPYFLTDSFPPPKSITYSVISSTLCHTIDYCSIALLKRTLPFEDKSIKFNVALKDIQKVLDVTGLIELKNLVVIHAGTHWETKTFPKKWWEEIINGLVKENIPVALIGKTNSEGPSVHVFDKRKGVINLVDLLDLDGLIALLSQTKILVGSDSSPIHLAGAFDNEIIVIPTVKHEDHILPFRKGTTKYKTTALYKKLLLDDYPSAPTEIKEIAAIKKVNEWDTYLLEPKKMIEIIKEKYGDN